MNLSLKCNVIARVKSAFAHHQTQIALVKRYIRCSYMRWKKRNNRRKTTKNGC